MHGGFSVSLRIIEDLHKKIAIRRQERVTGFYMGPINEIYVDYVAQSYFLSELS